MGGRKMHNRDQSRSSGSSGRQQHHGGIHLGPPFNSQLRGRGLGGSRVHTGRKSTLPATWVVQGMQCLHVSHTDIIQNRLQSVRHLKPTEVDFQSSVEHVRINT
jgi:hypothetical protein